MNLLPLPFQVYVILAGLIEERIGLRYGPEDQDLFAAKACTRAVDAGFDSMLDYYYLLRYDDPEGTEFDALIEALVVNETFLFREAESLRLVVDELLTSREDAAANGRRPRVWSAACATGEEALTLAMLLAEGGGLGQVEIVASDLSLRALDRARSGQLGPRAVRGATEGLPLDRWIRKGGSGYAVDRSLVSAIDWRRVNLLAPAEIQALGRFDVVVCRNVLIYFSDATAVRVARSLADALVPGGVLVIGVSESLLRIGTELKLEERRGVFLYRKGLR